MYGYRSISAFLLLGPLALSPVTLRSQVGSVTGTVRSTEGGVLAGTLVTLAIERTVLNTRTDATGAFRFSNVVDGRHELRVTLPGYSPWVQPVDLTGGMTVSVGVTLRQLVQQLDSVVVTAERSGVFGIVGDITTLATLDSALVQIVGFRSVDTTGGGGRFSLDRVPGGRSYVVRVVRPGYETRAVGIAVPAKGGFELIAFLEPGSDRRMNDEFLWREFDNRVIYGGSSAALVTRADLGGVAKANLMTRLTQARPIFLKGLRLHTSALSDPMSPTYPCIFVNGRLAPRSTVLDQFAVGEIVAIEAYGYGTLQYERLAGKLSSMPTGRVACGSPPRRYVTYQGPTGAPGIKGPPVVEPNAKSMVAVVVIWLRQ